MTSDRSSYRNAIAGASNTKHFPTPMGARPAANAGRLLPPARLTISPLRIELGGVDGFPYFARPWYPGVSNWTFHAAPRPTM